MSAPFFSVVIPTRQRPELLKQAVASVRAQTFRDIEVVVSNDDPDSKLAAAALVGGSECGIAVRVVCNVEEHGQSGNTNNGIRHARGKWIKLLHDDDVLYPHCLERIHGAIERAAKHAAIATACCRSDTLSACGGILQRWVRRCDQADVEILPSRYAVLAMYLQEDVGDSLPSSMCIRRELLISKKCWMPASEGFFSVVDAHWAIGLSAIGDRLIINEALVGKRQVPEGITGQITDEQLDREFQAIRELQFEQIPPDLRPPPLRVAKQALWIRRAAHRLAKRGQPLSAAVLAARAWDPRAWLLAARPALTQHLPGLFPSTPRLALADTRSASVERITHGEAA